MRIESFRTPGLGDQTYLMIHDGHAVLVDPQRDVDRFLSVAEAEDVEVRYVLETHLHTDYVSGGVEAARRTGAELVLPAAAAAAYDHTAAYHLEDLEGPGFTIRPIHTPGHTPEHTSYLVVLDGEPVAVFSGGSLLVGSAGRPDLLGMERARTLGKLQHRSVNRLAALPDAVELLPTHGAGSFCTVSGAGQYTSTIGAEKASSPVLQAETPEAMADLLLSAPMPIPSFYRHMGPSNTFGVPARRTGDVPAMTVASLRTLPEDTVVVDIRPRAVQAEGFLRGSLTVELADDFGSWAAWLVEHLAGHGATIVLVAEPGDDESVRTAATQLAQVGVDDVRGVITDLTPLRGTGDLATFRLVDVAEAQVLVKEDTQVLDVRQPSEHVETPLEGAVERFLPHVAADGVPSSLDQSAPVLVVCGSGRRAAIAASLVVRDGLTPIVLTGAGAPDLAAAATTA